MIAIVNFAREQGLRVAPQGTGHGASAIASLEHTILLSTKRMRGVRIDPKARRARVRAGAIWQDVTAPASAYGLAPLAGSAHDVGVVGYTLGGGLSWLAREHGFACDSVTAIELVTADGTLTRTDAHNDPELFRALCGGGGNFGVVTAMEFELYPVEELTGGAMLWPRERAEEIFNAWSEWTATLPNHVTSLCRLLNVPPLPDVPEPLRGRSFVVVEVAILGDDAILAPLRALAARARHGRPDPAAALIEIHNDPKHPMPGLADHRVLAEASPQAITALTSAAGPELVAVELRDLGGNLPVWRLQPPRDRRADGRRIRDGDRRRPRRVDGGHRAGLRLRPLAAQLQRPPDLRRPSVDDARRALLAVKPGWTAATSSPPTTGERKPVNSSSRA